MKLRTVLTPIAMAVFICLLSFTDVKSDLLGEENSSIGSGSLPKVFPKANFPVLEGVPMFPLKYKSITQDADNAKAKKAKRSGTYIWWIYSGGLYQQHDPYYYNIDGDQWPDCFFPSGPINCNIKALPQEYDAEHPDMSTIIAIRYHYY